jgi:hypothetical protein
MKQRDEKGGMSWEIERRIEAGKRNKNSGIKEREEQEGKR